MKRTPKAAALALYMNAATLEDYRDAAHALAAVLDVQAKPKAAALNLAAPVPRPKRAAPVLGFLCAWTDGSSTYQRVTFDPRHKWAAAFQACDRLRRLRARHGWRHVLALAGLPSRTHGMLGIEIDSPDWLALVAAVEMPALVEILCEETGETFRPESIVGAGDPVAVFEAVARMALAAEARRAQIAQHTAAIEAARAALLADVRQPYRNGLRVVAQAA